MKRLRNERRIALPSFLAGLAFYCAVASNACFALDPSKSVFQYNCRTWTRQNGLPASGVTSITQTRDGYLWLGSAEGLITFDGIEFRSADMGRMGSPVVTSISSSKSGGLWFGLEHGAFGFCGVKGVSFMGTPDWGGITLNVHSVMEGRDGGLWIASETSLARLDAARKYSSILPGEGSSESFDVMSVLEDSQGRVWIGTGHRGLYYLEAGVLKRFPDPIVNDQEIRSMAQDKLGQLWIGTDWGVLCYSSNLVRQPFPFPWYPTRALLADREGTLWMGTLGSGLACYRNGHTSFFRKQDGLAEDVVTSLAEDNEGNLWVGTRSGLSQLSDIKIPTFGKTEGLTADVNSDIYPSRDGGFWIATGEGFTYFNQAADQIRSFSLGLTNNYVNRIFEARDGKVYLINGYKDVEVFSGGKALARYPNTDWPTALGEDARSVIMARGNNLFRLETNGLVPYEFSGGQSPGLGWIFNIISGRDGALWIASGAGLCRVNKDQTFKTWSQQDGLPDSKATFVCEGADSTIWVGTEKGIGMLRNGRMRGITHKEGLFNDITYAVIPDDRGNVWVDSSRGFFSISRQSLEDFASRRASAVQCTAYTGAGGVKSSERFQQQFTGCRTLDGRIWFPIAQGIAMIDPAHISKNSVAPQVYIQSARANGRDLNPSINASVKPGRGELEFHYAGLSYLAPLAVHYRYRLKGYDANWVDAGTRRSAFYTNLKPGQYRFQVQACNEDGVWNTDGAALSVDLLPYFYETTWFLVLAISASVAGIAGLYGYRLRQLQQKQKHLQESRDLLEAKVQERTAQLQQEIEERKRIQLEVERVHRELVDASRQAGQAEVASSVLHNVGNVLNSVNVSACMIRDQVRTSKAGDVNRVGQLLAGHRDNLQEFLTSNGRIDQLINYLKGLSECLASERTATLAELETLTRNIDHIKQIVAMQQNYARVSGVQEMQSIPALIEDALRMHESALQRDDVRLIREFESVPDILVDRHKVLQILVNLIVNAQQALKESAPSERTLTLAVRARGENALQITVGDNGIGIPPENLTRIFTHGFTTRAGGHGFGLHSGALAAKEIGGSLVAQSDGPGRGATFVLELPVKRNGVPA